MNEGAVLLATMRFLRDRKAFPYQVSVPKGKGIDSSDIKTEIIKFFADAKFEPSFVSSGPDVVAISENEWWLIECKGAGLGKAPTFRNNFDRALASTVSYYEDKLPDVVPDWAKSASVFLGLAIPNVPQYIKELRRRVRKPLRQRLNLWVLLYHPEDKRIVAISPEDDYKTIT